MAGNVIGIFFEPGNLDSCVNEMLDDAFALKGGTSCDFYCASAVWTEDSVRQLNAKLSRISASHAYHLQAHVAGEIVTVTAINLKR